MTVPDPSSFSTSEQAQDLYGHSIRGLFDYDAFGNTTVFKAVVLTEPTRITEALASVFGVSATVKKLTSLLGGASSSEMFLIRGRIDSVDPKSPHDCIPDPCSIEFADKPEEAAKLMAMHTIFVSTEATSQHSLKVGDIINVRLQKEADGKYNLQYGEIVGLVSTAPKVEEATACQKIAELISPEDKFSFRQLASAAVGFMSGIFGGGASAPGSWPTSGNAPCTGERVVSPVIPENVKITSKFGAARGKSGHGGVDFAPLSKSSGEPIFAMAAGTITYIGAGKCPNMGAPTCGPGKGKRPQCNCGGGFGNYIRITNDGTDQGRKITTTYGHLRNYAPGLAGGMHVEAGQQIGFMGTTGNSSGPHLHMEVKIQGIGKIDAIAYMKVNQNPGQCYGSTTYPEKDPGETYDASTSRHGESTQK